MSIAHSVVDTQIFPIYSRDPMSVLRGDSVIGQPVWESVKIGIGLYSKTLKYRISNWYDPNNVKLKCHNNNIFQNKFNFKCWNDTHILGFYIIFAHNS